MRLNQSGELLYNHIRSTMFDFDRVRGGISELRGQITGEVRITTLGSLVVDFLPTAIEAFASQYPSVRYEVRESLAVEVIDQIVSGEADIGFGFVQLVRGALDVVEEFRHPVGVILSPQHPLAQEQSIPRSACIEFPIVTHTGSFATLRAIQPMLAAENTTPAIVLRTNSLPIVRQFVKANRGLTFATPLGFKDDLARGNLVYRPFAEKAGELRIGLLIPRTRKIPPATSLMVKELRLAMVEINQTDF